MSIVIGQPGSRRVTDEGGREPSWPQEMCVLEKAFLLALLHFVLFSSVALLAAASHPTGKHSVVRLQSLSTQGSEPAVSLNTLCNRYEFGNGP